MALCIVNHRKSHSNSIKKKRHLLAKIQHPTSGTVASNNTNIVSGGAPPLYLVFLWVDSILLQAFPSWCLDSGKFQTYIFSSVMLRGKHSTSPRINVLHLDFFVYSLDQVPALVNNHLVTRDVIIFTTSLRSCVFSCSRVWNQHLPNSMNWKWGREVTGFPRRKKKQSSVEVGLFAGQTERTSVCYRVEITNNINDCYS